MEPLKKIILVLDETSYLYGKIIVFSFFEDKHFSGFYVGEAQVGNHIYRCSLWRLEDRIEEGNWIEITEENKDKWERLIPFL